MTSETMPQNEVEVEVVDGVPICRSLICSYCMSCSLHCTTCSYERENGLTPDLEKIFDYWYCSMEPVDNRVDVLKI